MEGNENINNNTSDENNGADVNIDSWVFVNKELSENSESKPDVNFDDRFVQRLSEEDLGSAEKASDSDSDGISIISENENDNEEQQSQEDFCTCLSESNTSIDKDLTDVSETHSFNEISNNNVLNRECDSKIHKKVINKNKIAIFTTMTAVSFTVTYLLLAKYFNFSKNSIKEKIIIAKHDLPASDMTNLEVQCYYNNLDEETKRTFIMDNTTCELNFETLSTGTTQNILEKIYDLTLPFTKIIDNRLGMNRKNTAHRMVIKHSEKKRNIPNDNKNYITKHNTRKNEYKKDLKIETLQNRLKSKENYLKKKDKYLNKKERYLIKLEKYVTELEAQIKKKYKNLQQDPKIVSKRAAKNNFKQTTNSNLKSNEKEKRQKNQKHAFEHQKTNGKNRQEKKRNNGYITGEWYENLHTERTKKRNEESLSDWMFDRSKMRSTMRGKENWYFERAFGRKQFRTNDGNDKRKKFKTCKA